DAFERDLIYKALQKNSWRRNRTADYLGIPYSTLKYKINRFNLPKRKRPKKARPGRNIGTSNGD
ncbi:MAG: hypothetical protein JSU92_04035, partial [Deltaproteobacteria bacterium]